MSRLAIPPARSAELVAAFRARSGLVEQADGFVDLQVWQSDRDAGEIVMVSRWRDRDAFKVYMKSADHQVSHGRIDPDLKEDIRLMQLDHLHRGGRRVSVRPRADPRPPDAIELEGHRYDLSWLARAIADRYYREYPDEIERYGDVGVAWCHHDNQWLLAWAVDDVRGAVDLDAQARWLARVLHARAFPVDRLVRDLHLAADVMQEAAGRALGPGSRRAPLARGKRRRISWTGQYPTTTRGEVTR